MDFEEANSDSNMESFYDDDTESEDTLSLCDYSTNSAAAHEEEVEQEYSRQLLQTSSSTSTSGSVQDQHFEFCCEEWSTTTTSHPPENIIFCGKIIPYGESSSEIGFQNLMSVKESKLIKKPAESFPWNGSCNINTTNTGRKEKQKLEKLPSVGNKISVLNSVRKLRWSFLLFGGSRTVPTEMALRDIKNRQSRKNPSPSSTLFGLESDHDKKMAAISQVGSKNRSPQGLLGLLKTIGSGGQHHANNVVKASICCIPRL